MTSSWAPPSLDVPDIPNLPVTPRRSSMLSHAISNLAEELSNNTTITNAVTSSDIENEVNARIQQPALQPTLSISNTTTSAHIRRQSSIPIQQQQQFSSPPTSPKYPTIVHDEDEEISSVVEDHLSQKRMSFHVLVQENGSVIPMVSSLFTQLQSDIARVLDDKFSSLKKMKKVCISFILCDTLLIIHTILIDGYSKCIILTFIRFQKY
jgi:hypothetical protein